MKNKISVFTTLFNHEKFILQTLESATNQTLQPDEIIVIDDGSSDNSVSVAKTFIHPSIKIFSEKNNFGGANTVKGLKLCQHEFIAILNSDDCWLETKLAKQIEYLEMNPNCGAVFTLADIIDENTIRWDDNSLSLQKLFDITNRSRTEWLRDFFSHGNCLVASSAVLRRSCLEKTGLLDGSIIQLQDFDMWVRILIAGYDIHVIEEPLTQYRLMRNKSNMSTPNIISRTLHDFEFAKVLRHYWQITTLAEFSEIFTEIKISPHANDSMVLFYLAQHASRQNTIRHSLFAAETMSRWGGNYERMEIAYRCHEFDFHQYATFLFNSLGFLSTKPEFETYDKSTKPDFKTYTKALVRQLLPNAVCKYLKKITEKKPKLGWP